MMSSIKGFDAKAMSVLVDDVMGELLSEVNSWIDEVLPNMVRAAIRNNEDVVYVNDSVGWDGNTFNDYQFEYLYDTIIERGFNVANGKYVVRFIISIG